MNSHQNTYPNSTSSTVVFILRMDTLRAAEWIKHINPQANVILINTFRDITSPPNPDVPLDTVWGWHSSSQDGLNIGVVSIYPAIPQGFEFTQSSLLLSRAKLQEAFSKCIEGGANIIVTPMFGAENDDRNPPESVAEVLISVITEFAGRVQSVFVASDIDKDPFSLIAARILGIQNVFGFGQGSQSLANIPFISRFFNGYLHGLPPRSRCAPVCECGGFCNSSDTRHFETFIHPPLCPNENCFLREDDYHKCLFWHKRECIYGCWCGDPSGYHRYFFSHNASSPQAASQQKMCRYGYKCTKIFSRRHVEEYFHPFLPLCPDIYTCKITDSSHLSMYSHLCQWGKECHNEDPNHLRAAIHLEVCRKGLACDDFTDEHRDAFIHPESQIKRVPCKYGIMCFDKTAEHRKKFSHYKVNLNKCESKMLNVYDPIVFKYQKDKPFYFVDFDRNVAGWEAKLDTYIRGAGGIDTNSPSFKAIQRWISAQLPNHMCSGSVFLSMMRTGSISSLEHLRSMWENPKFFCANVATLPHVAPSIEKIKIDRSLLMKYIKKYVMKYQFEVVSKHKNVIENMDKGSTAYKVLNDTPKLSNDQVEKMNIEFSAIKLAGTERDVKEVKKVYSELVDHIFSLMTNVKGCQSKDDEPVRTNYTPFSIYGPHNYDYGGSEVVLVLSREITFHPDFYICPVAACLYFQGKSRSAFWKSKYPVNRTPWMGGNIPWPQHEKDYYEERFSPVADRWSIAAVKEVIARAAVTFGKSLKDVTVDDVKAYWNGSNAHYVFESHLPYSVPLSYVRHIIITKKAYDEINATSFGKAAFDKWRTVYGKSFFSLVPGPEDVRRTSGTWPAEHPSPLLDNPKGFCFVLDKRSRETFVPIRLAEGKRNTYFSFMAKGGDFFFTVSSTPDYAVDGEIRNVITFYVAKDGMGLSASLHPPLGALSNPLKTDNDSYAACFNESCQHTPYVYYEVSLDYKKRTVAVYHYGPSRSYNSCIFIVPMDAPRYSYISFCRTSDVLDSELPVIWNLRQNPTPTPKGLSANNMHRDVEIKAKVTDGDRPKAEIPLCDKPFTCPIFWGKKSQERTTHCSSFKHICRKGQTCKKLKNRFHSLTKLHMDKPFCPNANCGLLYDPAHRMEYRHPNIWDYLILCKYGDGCGNKGDPKHCKKYHHDPNYVYPDPSTLHFK